MKKNNFSYIVLLVCIGIISLIVACGGDKKSSKDANYPRFASDDNTLVQYMFPVTKNTSLAGDSSGSISDNAITLTVPHNADVTNLAAEFVTNSTDVKVGGAAQVSGTTRNNFTAPVTYTVTAENSDARTYTVTVTKAPSYEKSITAFSLNGNAGVINEANGEISVEFLPKTAVTSLMASFSTTGTMVAVNGTEQESGVTAHDFTNPVVYRVTAQDGSTKDYTVTATVLKAAWKDMTTFAFYKSDNPSLAADVLGIVNNSDGTIALELPFGSSTGPLIAAFETNGESVTVGETAQQSGVTSNNFGEALTYKVTAEDNSSADYTVTVTVAKNDAKAMTSFGIAGEAGAISEVSGDITVNLPVNAVLTGLTASFAATGVSVKVSGVDQVSGVTENDFSSPVRYDVTAENGSVKSYIVTAVKQEDMAGLWNFETGTEGTSQIFEATTVDGLMGDALLFDGYNDYVRVPDSDTLTLGEAGTVEALVWISAYKPFAGIVHKGVKPDFSDEAFSLQIWGYGGIVRMSIFSETGEYAYADCSTELALGHWYYIVGTWDAAEIAVYINGSKDVSAVNTAGVVMNSSGDMVIGAQLADIQYNSTWHNLGFNGIIDRVQLHSRALTAEEINARYNEMLSQGGGALAAYLLSAVKTRGDVIAMILVVLAVILGAIYFRNRKRAVVE